MFCREMFAQYISCYVCFDFVCLYVRFNFLHTTACGQKESEGGLKLSPSPAVESITWKEKMTRDILKLQRLRLEALSDFLVFWHIDGENFKRWS